MPATAPGQIGPQSHSPPALSLRTALVLEPPTPHSTPDSHRLPRRPPPPRLRCFLAATSQTLRRACKTTNSFRRSQHRKAWTVVRPSLQISHLPNDPTSTNPRSLRGGPPTTEVVSGVPNAVRTSRVLCRGTRQRFFTIPPPGTRSIAGLLRLRKVGVSGHARKGLTESRTPGVVPASCPGPPAGSRLRE